MKAIIFGTGIDSNPTLRRLKRGVITNDYGSIDYYERGELLYIPRHGIRHTSAPSSIKTLAIAQALLDKGVDEAISLCAVGSITDTLPVMGVGLVEDFIDFTHTPTFFEVEGRLKHTDFSNPFDQALIERVEKLSGPLPRVVYGYTAGPRLETKAEIRALRVLGADVVGMTLSKEIIPLVECGIRCAALCYSINAAAGVNSKLEFVESEMIEETATGLLLLSEGALLDGSSSQ